MTAPVTIARYNTNQPNARYAGNRLIEALPPPPTEQQLIEELQFLPHFDPASRRWERHMRLGELLSLTNIMVPLSAHVQLAFKLDSMLREGYVGRRPMTAEHMAVYQEIHEDRQRPRAAFRQTHETLVPKLSAALVGVSGMGKTTTVQRFLHRYDQVIYHPELGIHQIPWLHFEMPANGKGVKALLTNIIEAIADLIPDNTYYEDHIRRGRATEESLQSSVRILLNKHCVGLLIPDEVQNVANTRKSEQEVMTHLTTLANKSKTPVLYIGTPKAERVLGLDLRQGRRSIDLGLGNWYPLPRHEMSTDEHGRTLKSPGEWVEFMSQLWDYSWVQNPTPLTEPMLDVFYDCTQGIIDLAIKLLIVAQARAILDGVETLSEQLVRTAYAENFKMVRPMIEALRTNDWAAIAQFEDVRPASASVMLEDITRSSRVRRIHAVTTRPGDADFEPRLVAAGKMLGLPDEDSEALARQVAEDGTATTMLEAAAQMAKKVAPLKPVATKRGSVGGAAAAKVPAYTGLDERPDDLRHAIVAAAAQNTSIVSQLLARNQLPDPETLLCLD